MTLIYHLFADDGVESRALEGFGRVVRVGIDPLENDYSEVVRADATDPPLKPVADLAFAQPVCLEWALAPRSYDNPNVDHPDQIPAAREACRRLAEHYIIENVPTAPLRDPVVLNGSMFRLPAPMERAFETSFPVPQPGEDLADEETVYWWNEYTRPMDYWKAVKGYGDDHRKDPFVKSGIPRAYMDYLLRYWVIERDGLPRTDEETVRQKHEAGDW